MHEKLDKMSEAGEEEPIEHLKKKNMNFLNVHQVRMNVVVNWRVLCHAPGMLGACVHRVHRCNMSVLFSVFPAANRGA